MKAIIVIALAVIGMITWGVSCIINPTEWYHKEQGWSLTLFAIPIGVVLYFATRPRIGR